MGADPVTQEVKSGETRVNRLRVNVSWALGGSVTYNLVQWFLVVVLARLGSPEMVGQFALAQAIAAPVYLTVGLNLRVVRATDVTGRWTAHQYMGLRRVLNVIALVVTVIAGLLFGMREVALAVLLMVALGKASEATSQLLYGYFQFRGRLDLVARSMLLRSALGSSLFLAAFLVTREVVPACAGLAVGWFLTYVVHDRPADRRLRASDPRTTPAEPSTYRALARKAFPLGIDAGVSSLTNNVPRFGVQHQLGTSALGQYAALAYLAQVVTMVTNALAESLIGHLARSAAARNARAFVRAMALLVACGAAVSLVALVGAWLLGEVVIRVLLGPEYVNQPVLLLLLAAAAVTTLLRSLERGLQAAHRYTSILALDVVALVVGVAAAVALIPTHGQAGAAAALGIGYLAACLLAVGVLASTVRHLARAVDG